MARARPSTSDLAGLRRVAIVATGGGARGAYEAGALAELVPALVGAGMTPSIFVGTSAGSINAVLLACVADRFDSVEHARSAMDEVLAVWLDMRCSDVFRPLLHSSWATAAAYAAELVRLPRPRLTGLLDTTPLIATSETKIDWPRLHANVASGAVRAVGLTATTSAGWTRVFLEQPEGATVPAPDDTRALDYCPTVLQASHLRASCALPVLFPPVAVSSPPSAAGWYLDGGVRLNAPLKPALALGAEALLLVASHSASFAEDDGESATLPRPEVDDVLAQVLDSLMADRMIEDLMTLSKVNDLVLAGGQRSGARTYAPVPYVVVAPQGRHTLGEVAAAAYEQAFGGWRGALFAVRRPDLPLLRRLLGGGDGVRGGDLLSYLFFDRAFGEPAVALGQRDARRALLRNADGPPWRFRSL